MTNTILENFTARDAQLWGKHTVQLRHRLHKHPLFSDEGLAELIDACPDSHIAINTMDPSGHRLESWSYCDRHDLKGHQVLAAAKMGRIWINMRKIEQVSPAYQKLLDEIFGEFEEHMPDFKTFRNCLGVLVSSPKAQVFYHCDVPGQSLWQLRGRKRIYIYPPEAPFLEPHQVENVIRGITEEEIAYQPWFDDYAEAYDLQPGQMLHWKLNGPHRVVNEDCINVSLTSEHWTKDILRSFAMNAGNGILRSHLGWAPHSRALSGPAFWAKAALGMGVKVSGIQQRMAYKRTMHYRIDPQAPDGVVPIDPIAA